MNTRDKQTSGRRLLKLASFLETLPRKKFDYSVWAYANEWDGKQPFYECETTACALGWAATMPEFRRLGLRLDKDETGSVKIYLKTYEYAGPFYAAKKIFHLDLAEASFLFSPNFHYNNDRSPDDRATAKCVAKHIRKFVKTYR